MLLLIVGGCGESPTEKCDDLLSTVCSRVVECIGGVTQQACVQEFQAAVSCGAVTDISESYDRCMDQLHGFTCSTLFPTDPATGERLFALPADCVDVFSTGDDVAGEPAAMEATVGALMESAR
ncbi:MAG: hypothetical protein F9K40_01565 [Kofleriaceae bacterium]|nr:MAG: hypothetical protein F9K40_01565 [Kofleriaceae bacterium]